MAAFNGRGRALLRLAAGLGLVACGSDPAEPGAFSPEVTNLRDDFRLEASVGSAVTLTRLFGWVNTGPEAEVQHSTVAAQGTAELRIRDDNTVEVYRKTLSNGTVERTATGVEGLWTFELVLREFRGTLGFRVVKR